MRVKLNAARLLRSVTLTTADLARACITIKRQTTPSILRVEQDTIQHTIQKTSAASTHPTINTNTFNVDSYGFSRKTLWYAYGNFVTFQKILNKEFINN